MAGGMPVQVGDGHIGTLNIEGKPLLQLAGCWDRAPRRSRHARHGRWGFWCLEEQQQRRKASPSLPVTAFPSCFLGPRTAEARQGAGRVTWPRRLRRTARLAGRGRAAMCREEGGYITCARGAGWHAPRPGARECRCRALAPQAGRRRCPVARSLPK
jgi:hypothetical protein